MENIFLSKYIQRQFFMDSKYSIPLEYNWRISMMTCFGTSLLSQISISHANIFQAKFLGSLESPKSCAILQYRNYYQNLLIHFLNTLSSNLLNKLVSCLKLIIISSLSFLSFPSFPSSPSSLSSLSSPSFPLFSLPKLVHQLALVLALQRHFILGTLHEQVQLQQQLPQQQVILLLIQYLFLSLTFCFSFPILLLISSPSLTSFSLFLLFYLFHPPHLLSDLLFSLLLSLIPYSNLKLYLFSVSLIFCPFYHSYSFSYSILFTLPLLLLLLILPPFVLHHLFLRPCFIIQLLVMLRLPPHHHQGCHNLLKFNQQLFLLRCIKLFLVIHSQAQIFLISNRIDRFPKQLLQMSMNLKFLQHYHFCKVQREFICQISLVEQQGRNQLQDDLREKSSFC